MPPRTARLRGGRGRAKPKEEVTMDNLFELAKSITKVYQEGMKQGEKEEAKNMKTQIKNTWETLEQQGVVRFAVEPDEISQLADLEGDLFNPTFNHSVTPEKLAEDRETFIEKVNQDGVWGIVGEYWNGERWQQADSVWGFVGDDWKGSGYDEDIKSLTIKAFKKQKFCPTCHRPMKEIPKP